MLGLPEVRTHQERVQDAPLANYSVGKRGQPSVAAPPAEGPQAKAKPQKRGRKKKKKATTDSEGWQQPGRTAAPVVARPTQPIESSNRYGALTNLPETEQPSAASTGGALDTGKVAPPTKTTKPAAQPKPRKVSSKDRQLPTEESDVEQAQQIFDRPHQASYFIPGKVEGRPAQFLLDTGCTTNLLGKHVYDRLPEAVRSQRRDYAKHGLLADGTRLPFYGILQLNIRLRQVKTQEVLS